MASGESGDVEYWHTDSPGTINECQRSLRMWRVATGDVGRVLGLGLVGDQVRMTVHIREAW